MHCARNRSGWTLCGLGLLAMAGLTGCQVSVGGQTLPSPYYIYDDVQYFPSGHEFLLQNEADFLTSQIAPPPGGVPLAPGVPPVPGGPLAPGEPEMGQRPAPGARR